MSEGQKFLSFPASMGLKKRVKKMAHKLELSQAEYMRGLIEKDLASRESRISMTKERAEYLRSPEMSEAIKLDQEQFLSREIKVEYDK